MKTIQNRTCIFIASFVLVSFLSCALPYKNEVSGRDNSGVISEPELTLSKIPMFTGKTNESVFNLKFTVSGNENPVVLNKVTVSYTDDSNLQGITSVVIKYSGNGANTEFGSETSLSERTLIRGNLALGPGSHILSFGFALKPAADLLTRFRLKEIELSFKNHSPVKVVPTDNYMNRVAMILRARGQDNCDTYRIPGLITTNKGSLIAVYDNRYNNSKDLQEDIDIGMSRSTDGGQTWAPMKVIMDMGEYGGRTQKQNGTGDPCILFDTRNNVIWVAALWMSGAPDQALWRASAPGLKPEETGQFMLVKSTDDGLTWSQPINITSQIKNPAWQLLLQGPGRGITMKDGTLVFPAQFKADTGTKALDGGQYTCHSTIVYSRDGGQNWQIGTGAKPNTTEAQVVELADGSLMLNMRDDLNRSDKGDTNGRAVATTSDFGKTWNIHPSSNSALPESNCMASLISTDQKIDGITRQVLFFSNPNNKTDRSHMTVKASLDGGLTWPGLYQQELFSANGYGYSCMTMVDENTVGILYEGTKELFFQKIPVKDIISTPVYSSVTGDTGGFRLAPVFSEHMVFQQKKPVEVYGFSNSNDKVEIFFHSQYSETRAGSDGKWKITMLPLPAGGPYILQIRVNGVLKVDWNDVLSGEVWFCSGQSNMEFELKLSENGQSEAEKASDNMFRLFNYKGFIRTNNIEFDTISLKRINNLDYFEGLWQPCSPETASEFSAIGYYFGKNLRQKLKVPVGLILVAVGGAPIEAFTDRKSLEFNPVLVNEFSNKGSNDLIFDWVRQRISRNNALSRNPLQRHPYDPAYIFEAGMEPLGPFPAQGVIWYQGESNAHNAGLYKIAFTEFVNSWRKFWHNQDLPVFFAQLSSLDRPSWPQFRDVQRQLADEIPNTALVVTSDLGDSLNVHPVRKKKVGERFALQAFNKTYGLKALSDGPSPLKVINTEKSLIITFKSAGKLKTSDGKTLHELEISGEDAIFRSVPAVLKRNRIIIKEPGKNMEAVRYGWKPFSHGNLVNEADLPASTFLIHIN